MMTDQVPQEKLEQSYYYMLSYQQHEERAQKVLNTKDTLGLHRGKNYLQAALDEIEALREYILEIPST